MQQYEKLLCHLVIFCVSPLAVFFHGSSLFEAHRVNVFFVSQHNDATKEKDLAVSASLAATTVYEQSKKVSPCGDFSVLCCLSIVPIRREPADLFSWS
jgi:hypothetical protein